MTLRALQVGCVWPSERAGGGDRVFADLARYLPDSGVGVEALFAGPAGDGAAARLSSFAAATDGTRARWLGARRAIADRLDAGRVDVLATHFALYASAAIGRLRRVPHVVHFHGPWAEESRHEGAGRLSAFAKWGIEQSVYRTAARVIVLSEAFARVAAGSYGIPRDRIRIVPGGADLRRFLIDDARDEARRQLGWPTDRPILVTVRRLIQRTGVDRLIEALPAVRAAVPGARLYVAGTGPHRAALERHAERLGLTDAVCFTGYVPDTDLPRLYRAANLNVVPTVALEGFGLTVVEALAAGTPSMVTPIGGLPEIVAPLSPHLVFASAAPADIAGGLIDALAARVPVPAEAACRAFAVGRFSAAQMARRVADVYHELCA